MSRKRINIRKINSKLKRKMAFLFITVVLALIALLIRVVYINKTSGDKYAKKVLAQQNSNSTTIAYKRGIIYDRNGTILANSEKVYNVILDPKVLSAYEEKGYEKLTLTMLSESFPSHTKDELFEIYQAKKDSNYVVLEENLTKDEIASYEAAMDLDENGEDGEGGKDGKHQYKGVWLSESYLRTYPYGNLACNVVGYTVPGNVGQYGLEEYYSDTLNGVDGRRYSTQNGKGESETTIYPAQDGNSIESTIDLNIQQIVENELQSFMERYRDNFHTGGGAKTAACIIMNPQNGEVLAMASNRQYDPNSPKDINLLVSEEITVKTEDNELFTFTEDNIGEFLTDQALTEEQKEAQTPEDIAARESRNKLLDAGYNALWRNYCVSDTYEPGSTVKPITVAAGLEEGILTGNETYFCDGSQTINGSTIHCAKRSGHGMITLEGAIMFSCNDALMQIGAQIGSHNLVKYQRAFNFGLRTNIDLPGESRTDSMVYYTEEDAPMENLVMNGTELATCSFGQGYNVTMIQVASAFSACVNGGNYYQPHTLRKILDSEGGTVESIGKTLVRSPISEETSNTLKQYLYDTMYGEPDGNGNSATGKKARIAGYALGGKTGTAQKVPRGSGNYLVSFIGYAPYDTPEVVCYVIVDEPNSDYQASSSYAQEIWKNVMKQVLPSLNIYETEEPPADMQEEYDETHSDMAQTEGTDVPEAQEEDAVSEDGTYIDPQTGETVRLPDVSGDSNIDETTGELKDLTQDDSYPSEILSTE